MVLIPRQLQRAYTCKYNYAFTYCCIVLGVHMRLPSYALTRFRNAPFSFCRKLLVDSIVLISQHLALSTRYVLVRFVLIWDAHRRSITLRIRFEKTPQQSSLHAANRRARDVCALPSHQHPRNEQPVSFRSGYS